jgi:hypothetical protein
MKRITILALVLLIAGLAFGQITNPPGYVAPVNPNTATVLGPAGVITSTNLTITVSGGPIWCRGDIAMISNTNFTLLANSVYFVYYDCGGNQLYVSTQAPAPPYVAINQVTTGAATVSGTSDLRSLFLFPPAGGVGMSTYLTGSAYTNATTGFTSITPFAFPIAASQTQHLMCTITWQGSAGTTGPKYQWTGPGSPTAVLFSTWSNVTVSTYLTAATVVAFSTPFANTGTVTAATNFTDTIHLIVVNGTTAGTLQLQAAANGVGTLTIQPGSSCVVLP